MKYFDLHCDTPYEAFMRGLNPLKNQSLMVSPLDTSFEQYTQVMAIWSCNTLDNDKAYEQFFKILEHFKQSCLNENLPNNLSFILAIEGCGPLDGKIERLEGIINVGVQIATLMWKGVSSLGGAYDTDEGLSDFGRLTVRTLAERGIIIDLSHASDKSFYEAAELALEHGGRIIASHSDSRSVSLHRRNLTDEMFKLLVGCGSLVGINLCPVHLHTEHPSKVGIDTVLLHIEKFLSLGGEDILAMGCDFDGISDTPKGIKGVSDIPTLYRAVGDRFSIGIADKIFFKNAEHFFRTPNIL